MGNTLRFDNKNDVHRIYDLKGSTYSREVKGRVSSSSTLKDQNFVKNQHHVQEMNLSGRDCELINTAIRKDSNFLASLNIMDYSMLLGIEAKVHVNTGAMERSASIDERRGNNFSTTAELTRFARHRFMSTDGLQTYHLSIIDFLQLWNCNKKSEQFAKVRILRANKAQLSAVEP